MRTSILEESAVQNKKNKKKVDEPERKAIDLFCRIISLLCILDQKEFVFLSHLISEAAMSKREKKDRQKERERQRVREG